MSINLTQTAVEEIRRMQRQQSGIFFRLGIQPGGCKEFHYTLALHESAQPGDRCYESQGISILVDETSAFYINGLQLDYAEDLMGGGFRFDNPNAVQTCSCGLSFTVSNCST